MIRPTLLVVMSMLGATNRPAVFDDVARLYASGTMSADTVWTIERGVYAGMTITLRLDAAVSSRGRGEHFWRLPSGNPDAGIVGWRTTRYPIPVALRHGRASDEISERDSSAFWSVLDEMNAELGIRVFRPETVEATADPDDIVIVDVRPIAGLDGLSRASWSGSGELFDVRVTFHDAAVLHDRHVVMHEMMHALGFGHTTAWASVLNPWDATRSLRLTPEDVAYTELAMRLRERRERAEMRELVALAVERESSRFRGDEGYFVCWPDETTGSEKEEPMRNRALMPVGLLTVVSACAMGRTHQ